MSQWIGSSALDALVVIILVIASCFFWPVAIILVAMIITDAL